MSEPSNRRIDRPTEGHHPTQTVDPNTHEVTPVAPETPTVDTPRGDELPPDDLPPDDLDTDPDQTDPGPDEPTGNPPAGWQPDAHADEYHEDLDVVVTGDDGGPVDIPTVERDDGR